MATIAARAAPWTSMPQVSVNFDLADSNITDALGQGLARSIPGGVHSDAGHAGAVVYLRGELGAGKTSCVRSLLRALGARGPVRSPTYTLVETYDLGSLTCVHVDLYRVQTLTEVEELGLRDVVGPGCLLLVEWPERGAAALPPADVDLLLRYAAEGRQACVTAQTSLGAVWLENLGHDTSLAPYVSNLT
jgi:tRNA threonylcarbamoyladenosine biosynthesis protein TsaE